MGGRGGGGQGGDLWMYGEGRRGGGFSDKGR